MIEIIKIDELRVQLKCTKGIAKEISDMFTFFAKDYKFNPLYQRSLWDGKIRLFDLKYNTLPIGLLLPLLKECKKRDWNYSIDPLLKLDNFDQELENFIADDINELLFTPYDYQLDTFIRSIKLNRSFILSPTGSGKSFIIYLISRFLLDRIDGKILISVPSTNLVKQLHSDFCSYEPNRFLCDQCYEMSAGQAKSTSRKIIIATWQMLYRQPKEFFEQFSMLIIDEAHQANTKALAAIIQKMPNVKYRFGFTGTLDGSKTHEMQCRGWFGSIVKSLSTKELMDDGILSSLDIISTTFDYSKDEKLLCQEFDYHQEIKFITEHSNRNQFILDLANKQNKNTLVLFNFIKHGEELYEQAKKGNKKVYFIAGSIDAKEREKIRGIMEQENNIILFASFGTLAVGFNLKNLHTIIFAHPYKAQIRILQSIGRALRKTDSKEKAILIDIVDNLCYNKRVNFAYRHSQERLRIYEEQKFNIFYQ